MGRISKDEYYMNIAKDVSMRSTCNRRQYGAVVVMDDRILSTGYNGSPSGAPNCCDTGLCGRIGHAHNDGDYSTCPAIHAEANAINFVRKYFGNIDLSSAKLYLYGSENGKAIDASPCPICKKLIEDNKIRTVIGSVKNNGK